MAQFIGTIMGAIVTWALAYCYYMKAAQGLRSETQKIRKLITLVLRAMQDSDLAEVNSDEHGEIRGLNFKLKGIISAKSSVTGSASVTKK